MKLIFLIPLLKDGTNSESGGITINHKLLAELGLL